MSAILKSLFDKGNLKYLLIWPISLFLSLFFKVLGNNNSEVLTIDNFVVIALVFGPSLVVTIIVVLKRIWKI